MATLKKHVSFVCSKCGTEYWKELPKCITCGVAFTAEALKPSHNTQSDAIIANIKEYLIERAQQHDAWWLDDWVERGIDDYVNSRNNSTHL